MAETLPTSLLSDLSVFVERSMGLSFPPERWADLSRGIIAAARTFGYDDVSECAQWLMTSPNPRRQLDVLAGHLTVGETYFFREPKALEILAKEILPPLLHARRAEDRRLRIWSAACCTGEEAYTLAILLKRAIPDIAEWNITLLGSDVNPIFLRRAEAGIYGDWSFRNAPPWLKQTYFHDIGEGRFQIIPEVRQMVRFFPLNLVEDAYPALANDTNALDVIFCRNVLMYFSSARAHEVMEKLYRAQIDGGWLLAGAGEPLQFSHSQYVSHWFEGATFYQKSAAAPRRAASPSVHTIAAAAPPIPIKSPILRQVTIPPPAPKPTANDLYARGLYQEAIDELQAAEPHGDASMLGLLARSHANLGRLPEAVDCCDRWIAADKLNPSAHYLRAVILQEKGESEAAARSFRTALFANPRFSLAHFSLAHLAGQAGKPADRERHLRLARESLRSYRPEESLPESDGITAARLAEIIDTLLTEEQPA